MKYILYALLTFSAIAGVRGEGSPFLPLWPQRKCFVWGDALTNREAKERLSWARRCYPDFEAYYRLAENYKHPNGQRQALYPVFG